MIINICCHNSYHIISITLVRRQIAVVLRPRIIILNDINLYSIYHHSISYCYTLRDIILHHILIIRHDAGTKYLVYELLTGGDVEINYAYVGQTVKVTLQ